MARKGRAAQGGLCYHVINRGNGGVEVFRCDEEYRAFCHLMVKARDRLPMCLFAWCLMPNHFHLVARPFEDGDLSRWMQWLLTTHVRRHHARRGTSGHLWQGRFKAFPVSRDSHLLTVMRYVEANPLRAGLVERAEQWPWSSAAQRKAPLAIELLDECPVPLPQSWLSLVNECQSGVEIDSVRTSVNRGAPYGHRDWVEEVATRHGLLSTLRPRGRPRRDNSKSPA